MEVGTVFVKRPVTSSLVYLGVVLFDFLAWFQLPQELFPNISVPHLLIITKYPSAAPEEIENLITKPVEEAVGTVPNLKRIRSFSKEGLSAVRLEFGWGTDMGFAHLATREKLDRMKDRVLVPGSMREVPSDKPLGGLWIIEAKDEAEVRDIFKDDPFWTGGLRAHVRINRWQKAFPDRKVPI
jgi:HAE1 family hydrophobic/amphiphilic exporter-1